MSIVDVRLPPTLTDEGLRAAVDARRATPGLPVLVLSQHVEELYARELLAESHGAIGYLLKDRVFSDDQFLDAVRAVAGGGTVMDPPVQRRPLRRASHTSRRSSTNSTCRHPTRANRRVLAVLEYLGA